MTEALAPATVSLSRSPVRETPRHPPFERDGGEKITATAGLRALAHLVLTRDSRRDSKRDRVSRPPSEPVSLAETPEASAPARDEAEEERAALQNNGYMV
jgi:hypothetical protein